MFCSSLRKRPLWRTLGPLVASTSPARFQESNLETHDLALPLSFGHQEYHCPILVLTPANMVEAGLSDTKARVQQFVAAKKEQHHIITLILKVEHDEYSFPSGLEGFTRLQTLLFEINISCPVVPVPDVASLPTMLKEYLNGIQSATRPVCRAPIVTNLIAQAVASAPAKPLSEHDANVVSDIFSSLQEFEEATRTQQGQAKLYNFLDRTTAEDVIDFWADEWVV